MKNFINIKNACNNDIIVRGDKTGDYISVLESGYIILKDGTFVILGDDHGDSLTNFYLAYHGNLTVKNKFTTFDAIPLLSNDGFVIFLGTKRNIVMHNTDNFGFGIIFFPKELTEEQKISCKKLLATNYQVLNPSLKKISIEYGCGYDLKIQYTEEEVKEILKAKTK